MTIMPRAHVRHHAVQFCILVFALISTPSWAAAPPSAPVGQYCVESDCYATFEQALTRVKQEAGGHEIRAAGQEPSFDLAFPPAPATQPIALPVHLYYFESPAISVGPLESIAFGHRPWESNASVEPPFPCDGPLYPFLAPKCTSEQHLVEGLAGLLEYYYGDDYVPAGISGSWDTVVDPVNPFLQQVPLYLEEGERFPIVRTWSGKMAEYRILTPEGAELGVEEYPLFRHDVYSCPEGRIWGGAEYAWPVICTDPNQYVIKRRVDYGCDPCGGQGADISRASYTTSVPLASVEGTSVGLRYDSITRAWALSFEPRILWAYNFGRAAS